MGGPLVDGVEQRRHELPLPGTPDAFADHGGAHTGADGRALLRADDAEAAEPTSPLPESTYAPTLEPTEKPPTPRPTVISTYAPTIAETAPAEVASFNCTAFDGALLRIEDRDLTLRMEDGSFEVVWELPATTTSRASRSTRKVTRRTPRIAALRRVRRRALRVRRRAEALFRFVRVRARRRDDR